MSNAAKSILVHGIYLLGLGVVMITIPNVPLKIFGLPETNEVWIRVVGMLSLVVGYYYIQSARRDETVFFRSTILGSLLMRPFALSGGRNSEFISQRQREIARRKASA